MSGEQSGKTMDADASGSRERWVKLRMREVDARAFCAEVDRLLVLARPQLAPTVTRMRNWAESQANSTLCLTCQGRKWRSATERCQDCADDANETSGDKPRNKEKGTV